MSNAVELMRPEPQAVMVTPFDMINRAIESGASIEVMTKLMDLQERWEKNQARKDFDAAIAAAKAEIPAIVKNRKGHNNKRYADFAAIASVIDPILGKHGLSYRFRSQQDERIHVTCIISHASGHSEENPMAGPPDTTGNKNAIQAIGSTLSYLQRYSLNLALGLSATEDDDGKAAGAGGTITAEEAENIRDMLKTSGASEAKFLRWAKVDKIEDIPAAHYDSCVEAIKAVRGEKNA